MYAEILPDVLLLTVPLVLSALTLTTLHFFPWGRELARPISYALGTTVTVGVPVIAMLLAVALGWTRGELFWASLLLINAVWSGIVVLVCYWIDSRRPISLEDTANERG